MVLSGCGKFEIKIKNASSLLEADSENLGRVKYVDTDRALGVERSSSSYLSSAFLCCTIQGQPCNIT